MKKFFLSLAVFVMALCANAQTNQYFWYNGNLMMGNPIAQIDSVTFGNVDTDSILLYLPRTIIKEVHDTIRIIVHDTISQKGNAGIGYMGHEYVDLGLPSGLLWATCNLGAESPEQAGNYYAWGETDTKTNYADETYIYTNNRINLSDISATQYDAAHVNWGGEWRMPSRDEVAELTANCSRKDTTINDIKGIILRGMNGNYIFVPCSGHKEENGVIEEPEGVGFWTSSANGSSTAYRAWEWSYISFSWRREGFPIRPVVSKSDEVIDQTVDILQPQFVHDTVYITIHDTVCPNDVPEGTLTGEFSVSPTKKIRFSKGNLQYQASTNTWRFAENQWDFVGNATVGNVYENDVKCNNSLISPTYNGWIDLFGWGTGNNPTFCERGNSKYVTFEDWGNNQIENSNPSISWRTMSNQEYEYLINNRSNAQNLRGLATINDVTGAIFLPDDWQTPSGIVFSSQTSSFSDNVYTLAQWDLMENNGAVFFPCAHVRTGTVWESGNLVGNYWTSTPDTSVGAYMLGIDPHRIYVMSFIARQAGASVRLVQDVE